MAHDLVLLFVGFLLTTVFGTILGSFLQQRTWQHQNEARLREQEMQRAGDLTVAISNLLDKRLYRMLRFFYAVREMRRGAGSAEAVESRRSDYNDVLYEWNDSLNANLAAIGTSFGQAGRDWLSDEVYVGFQSAGSRLQALYRGVTAGEPNDADFEDVSQRLNALNDAVYRLGVFMTTQLRSGHVGRNAPSAVQRTDSPASVGGRAVPLAEIGDARPSG